MRCAHIKTNKAQCRGNAIINDLLCYTHSLKVSDEAKTLARANGGRANKIAVEAPLDPIEIATVKDVVLLLSDTVCRVRSGELELRVANTLGFLSGQLIKALEMSDLESRIEAIERAVRDNQNS